MLAQELKIETPIIRQAITVRFIASTDKTPYSRWSVSASAGRKMYSCGQFCENDQNLDSLLAAKEFCKYWGWSTDIIGGGMPNGDTVYVQKS